MDLTTCVGANELAAVREYTAAESRDALNLAVVYAHWALRAMDQESAATDPGWALPPPGSSLEFEQGKGAKVPIRDIITLALRQCRHAGAAALLNGIQ